MRGIAVEPSRAIRRTFCTFVREFSPLRLRAGWVDEGLSPIDTRTADGAIWSPNAPVFLLGDVARRAGTSWHLLTSFTGRSPRQG